MTDMDKETEAALRNRKTRTAVFPLSAGDVSITYPDGMTLDDQDLLEAYLHVLMQRLRRITNGNPATEITLPASSEEQS